MFINQTYILQMFINHLYYVRIQGLHKRCLYSICKTICVLEIQHYGQHRIYNIISLRKWNNNKQTTATGITFGFTILYMIFYFLGKYVKAKSPLKIYKTF